MQVPLAPRGPGKTLRLAGLPGLGLPVPSRPAPAAAGRKWPCSGAQLPLEGNSGPQNLRPRPPFTGKLGLRLRRPKVASGPAPEPGFRRPRRWRPLWATRPTWSGGSEVPGENNGRVSALRAGQPCSKAPGTRLEAASCGRAGDLGRIPRRLGRSAAAAPLNPGLFLGRLWPQGWPLTFRPPHGPSSGPPTVHLAPC